MGLDIRLPIGMMFTLLGALLVIYGACTNSDAMYQASLGININVIWGGVLFLFGAIMLLFALRARFRR
jgi:hypothetical protein